MTKHKRSKKSVPKSKYQRTSIGNSTTPKITKETVIFSEKLAEKDSKQKKKKDAKNTEDGIVRRLAKNGLIDKAKVKAAENSSYKKTKKKKGPSPSSSSHSDSSSSSTDSSSDSDDSSGDGERIHRRKRRVEKTITTINLWLAEAKSKVRKVKKIR